ncbi:interleukin-10 receptor subunit alpha [Aegotheles albertisi]
MAPCAAALALYLALLLARPTHGEELASPKKVRFHAETAHHLLCWEPGNNHPSDVRYEVQYIVYGSRIPWTPVPNCTGISGHSCDLTYYTLDPAQRYYAHVRAVSGNHTSPWARTVSFSPREARLRLQGQTLSVTGNTIHVQLQLLFRVGNLTVGYDEVQKVWRRYRVYIRSTQDNRTYEIVETTAEFNISNLFWDREYCVSVEPEVASLHVPTTRTSEQCLTTARRDQSTELVLSIVSSSIITLLLLGLLGALLVCTYVKKPVRPPSVLKSFIKQSSLWVEQETSSSSSPVADPIQQLFLCQKEPQWDNSPQDSSGTAQLPLERGWKLPAWPEEQPWLLGPGAMGSSASSCASTDSGICLHPPEPSCSSSPQHHGYKQQLPTGDDSGVGLEIPCPGPTGSSGSGELDLSHPQHPVETRGYLQQHRGTVQPRQDPAQGVPFSGSPQGPGSTDILLDMECPELAVAKGYLKQSLPEHSHAQDLAPWGTLSYGAPGAPLASKASPELLKSPLDLSIFNTDLLGTLPLISSLSTNEWLRLQIKPLSLLDGDSKDSRL